MFELCPVLIHVVLNPFHAIIMLCVCVCAGCQCVLEWSAAALAGAGLVHGRLVTYHPSGFVGQLPGCSALCVALGSPPPAHSGSF